MIAPLLLAPDNFTAPARTPWGGRRIAGTIKAGLVDPGLVVGESWELSVGPELPSRIDGAALADVIASDRDAWLGRESPRGGTALLVKLLDARDALSVQIHPRDGDPELAPGESGKPETWYVEHAEPGSVIWIGLAQSATREGVEAAIRRGDDLSAMLARVEVEAGDFFVVEAGTPHAIGPGVTLVEPQHVVPGRRGVTYRYWDWNRRYDAEGNPDPRGAARALHVDRALAVTDWGRPRGEAFLRSVRQRTGAAPIAAPLAIVPLCGAGSRAASEWLDVARVVGTGSATLAPCGALRSLTVLAGTIVIGDLAVARGRTAAIPAGAGALSMIAESAHAILAAAR